MKISKEALRGYLLEEAIAYLIRGTGYTLLVDKSQDPIELDNTNHGLVVKGRGANHQADVLGELSWIPAFTFPIRLFVEAKYRKGKTGIGPVRNSVGILDDINQNYFKTNSTGLFSKRYSYNYALFSTSGFTKDAVCMAIAHKISLIDLRSFEFNRLLQSIDLCASEIINRFCDRNIDNDDTIIQPMHILHTSHNGTQEMTSKGLVTQIRNQLRDDLGISPNLINIKLNYNIYNDSLNNILETMVQTVKWYGELFVGMAQGPYMLLLKADNPKKFLEFSQKSPSHSVSITWNKNDNNGMNWRICPTNKGQESYELSFTLPDTLAKFIFGSDNPRNYAIDVKKRYFSNITIYRSSYDRDELIRLVWDPELTAKLV